MSLIFSAPDNSFDAELAGHGGEAPPAEKNLITLSMLLLLTHKTAVNQIRDVMALSFCNTIPERVKLRRDCIHSTVVDKKE